VNRDALQTTKREEDEEKQLKRLARINLPALSREHFQEGTSRFEFRFFEDEERGRGC